MKLPTRITASEFFSILRQIVIDYPADDLCRRINTFTTYHQPSDYNTANFGKKYEDYQNGHFWSRDWVYAGADPGDIQKQYPLLHTEHTRSTIIDFDANSWSQEFWIVVSDIYDCEDCDAACRRTRDQVEHDAEVMLMNVLLEAYQYQKWKVTKDADEWLLWATEGKIQAMEAASEIDTYEHTNLELRNFVVFEAQTGQWGRGISVSNITGWGTRIQLRHCAPAKLDFSYTEQSIKEIGTANCITCR